MKILGVRVDNISREKIIESIGDFLSEDKFHQIATINPEFILRAQKSERFRNILNGCAMNVADGVGIKYAFLRYGKQLKHRIAGADLMHEILKIANKKRLEVFLAASTDGLSTWIETAAQLRKTHPNVVFGGDDINPKNFQSYEIGDRGYSVVLCSFGAPAQELFIERIKNDTIRLAMGVGGSFDFVCGKFPRAPKLMRDFGLEWAWRFALEPRYRMTRIVHATIVFPFKIIFSKK